MSSETKDYFFTIICKILLIIATLLIIINL